MVLSHHCTLRPCLGTKDGGRVGRNVGVGLWSRSVSESESELDEDPHVDDSVDESPVVGVMCHVLVVTVKGGYRSHYRALCKQCWCASGQEISHT